MAERPGLIGEADGGTMFLDEIGELPEELQSHLLRVLDADGEYQRLGDTARSRADIRLVAATNRQPDELKHDLLGAPHLTHRACRRWTRIGKMFLCSRATCCCGRRSRARTWPLVSWTPSRRDPTFTSTHRSSNICCIAIFQATSASSTVRCGEAMAESPSNVVELSARQRQDALDGGLGASASGEAPSVEEIRQAVAAAGGSVTKAARALGMPSRFALYRLMRKHGLDVKDVRSE